MSNAYAPPKRTDYTNEGAYRQALQQYGNASGQAAWSVPVAYTGLDDDGSYYHTLENQGLGGHLNIPNEVQVESDGSGTVIRTLTAGDVTATNLEVLGTTLLDGPTTIGNNAALDTLIVNAITAMRGPVTIQNAALTTLASFVVTAGAQTATIGNQTTPGLHVDVANLRTIVGTVTALGTAADDKLSVVGGAVHIASASTGTPAIVQGWRFGTAGTTYGLWIDAATNPSLIFKDDGGIETFRLGDTSSAYQAEVSGNFHVTTQADVAAALTANKVVAGATTFSSTEKLRVVGTSRLEGAVTITTGGLAATGSISATGGMSAGASSAFTGGVTIVDTGLTVQVGGITLAAAGNIDGNGGTAGQLRIGAVIIGTAALSGSEELRVVGQSLLEGAVTLTANEVTTGFVTPSQITSNQDNYSPTGLSTARVLRLESDASRNITGIAAQPNGTAVTLINVGATNNIVLIHDLTSTAANRFRLPGLANVTLTPFSAIELIYDSASGRWLKRA